MISWFVGKRKFDASGGSFLASLGYRAIRHAALEGYGLELNARLYADRPAIHIATGARGRGAIERVAKPRTGRCGLQRDGRRR